MCLGDNVWRLSNVSEHPNAGATGPFRRHRDFSSSAINLVIVVRSSPPSPSPSRNDRLIVAQSLLFTARRCSTTSCPASCSSSAAWSCSRRSRRARAIAPCPRLSAWSPSRARRSRSATRLSPRSSARSRTASAKPTARPPRSSPTSRAPYAPPCRARHHAAS